MTKSELEEENRKLILEINIARDILEEAESESLDSLVANSMYIGDEIKSTIRKMLFEEYSLISKEI